jgi:ribosomal protein L19E
MCGHEHGRHGHRRGRRGRGFPSREEWVERLEAHRERLERDLGNVDELLKRLRDEQPGPAPETASV